MSALGYRWLIEHLGLPDVPLAVSSLTGALRRERITPDGVVRVYPESYWPGASPFDHLEFALKHEGVDLPVLAAALRQLGPATLLDHLATKPAGKYARMLGFLHDFTQGSDLQPRVSIGGNYVTLLNPEQYVTAATPHTSSKWRVHSNLPGTADWCPMVRRSERLRAHEASLPALQAQVASLVASVPADLLARAADYLYLKETRSTYRIEHEDLPAQGRMQKFLQLLQAGGHEDLAALLAEPGLADCQARILDPRYAEDGFRHAQNYVGETLPQRERVHYPCPPPALVPSLMQGLRALALQRHDLHPVIHAALVAFGFVFIHPFLDGNGRLHRFLIHDILRRRGLVPEGLLLPVSATLLRDRRAYDTALESYSRPLADGLARFTVDAAGELHLHNAESLTDYYRYPDLTAVVEYLLDTVQTTVQEDFAEELQFLLRHDAARSAIIRIVDMPNRRLDRLLQFLSQNQGRLARGRRQDFAELSDAELTAIEQAWRLAFGLEPDAAD